MPDRLQGRGTTGSHDEAPCPSPLPEETGTRRHADFWKLDRLDPSPRDLIAMLDDLCARGAKFHSLIEAIDTATPTGRAMWQMIGVLAELKRSSVSECTRAGVKAAKRRSVKFGRNVKLSAEQIDHARKLIDIGASMWLTLGRSTLYRALAG